MEGREILTRHLVALAALHSQARVAGEALATSPTGALSPEQRRRLHDAQRVMREQRKECRAILGFARRMRLTVPELTPGLFTDLMCAAGLELDADGEDADPSARRRASAGAPRRAGD